MAIDVSKIKEKYGALKKKQEDQKKSGDNFLELSFGDNHLRLLSFDNPDQDFYLESGYHYLKNGSETKAVMCLKLAFGQRCYLSEVVDALFKTKDKKDKALAKDLKASSRYFMNCIDRDDKNKVKILPCGPEIFTQILGYLADPDWGDITDRETGHDITIEKKKTGPDKWDVSYDVRPSPKVTLVNVEGIELFDLEAIINDDVPTYEMQKMIFDGDEEGIAQAEMEKGEDVGTPVPDKPQRKAPDKPQRKAPTVKPEKVDESAVIVVLLDKLDLTDSITAGALKKWKAKDGSAAGLENIVALFGIESVEELKVTEVQNSSGDAIDDEIATALKKYEK